MNAESFCVCGHHAEEHMPQWGCIAHSVTGGPFVHCRCATYEEDTVPF
jgi:hypothetical protein